MARKIFVAFDSNTNLGAYYEIMSCEALSGYDKNPFYDLGGLFTIRSQGKEGMKNWVEKQLKGTSVVIILRNDETESFEWIGYTIQKSIEYGKGLLLIDIREDSGNKYEIPVLEGYRAFNWYSDNGVENIGKWVEEEAEKRKKR
ncbi:MAG: TIR domain-containing protein [Patescibacteria group bacterium]|nr:TIR domain-containing protein [Patescibacteria group bacterium]